MLSDRESISVYKSFIATHYNRTPQKFVSLPYLDQYFPFDIFSKKDYIDFVQLGGFDGDTLINLDSKVRGVKSAVIFEPDVKNFNKLKKTSSKLKNVKKIFLFIK